MALLGSEPSGTLTNAEIFELSPETEGGLTFHLPMELVALREAGASAEIITQRKQERLGEAKVDGLSDPPLYRWAIRRYTETAQHLLLGDNRVAHSLAIRDIEPLAEGLAGAAFHGLIRLGYGAWQRDAAEIARGLAYLRTRRQVLASPSMHNGILHISDGPHLRSASSPANGSNSNRQAGLGNPPGAAGPGSHDEAARADLPEPSERDGVTVFDLLNLAAGAGGCGTPDESQADTPRALALAAIALVRRNPSSFVAVHAATGFHALCEVELLLSGNAPDPSRDANLPMAQSTNAWWTAYGIALRACTLLVTSGPPEALPGYDHRFGSVTNIESLVAASIRSDDTHDVKLAVSLRRLVQFELLSNDEATAVGLTRLAAEQLT